MGAGLNRNEFCTLKGARLLGRCVHDVGGQLNRGSTIHRGSMANEP
jgi:hypothetical protein